MEQIEEARREKSHQLKPDTLSGAEKVLQEIKEKRVLERITAGIAGWRVRMGGLITGSGFALGPEYYREGLLDGAADFRTSARLSTRRYQRYDVLISFPHLAGDHLFVDLGAVHRNYPRIDYYGPGAGSAKTGRSNYRLEDTSLGFSTGVKPVRRLRLGADGEYLRVNVGPGTDPRFVSAERIYSPAATPGLDRQSNFMRGGPFIQFDYRDHPGGPRSDSDPPSLGCR